MTADRGSSGADAVLGRGSARVFPGIGRLSMSRLYESTLFAYLVSLLFLYPYGLALTSEANLRIPDIIAVGCLMVGLGCVSARARIRYDRAFLIAAAPFVLLELIAPLIGAAGYQTWMAAVSSLRMALLWLPAILLTFLTAFQRQEILERKLAAILKFSLWANAAYAAVQVMVVFGYAPRSLLVTEIMQPWAVDRYFTIVQGFRPAGFFVKTTALSVFGVVSLSFFYARYVARHKRIDLGYALLALFVILLTTSRVAAFAAGVILLAGWIALPLSRKAMLSLVVAIGLTALLALIERTVGIQEVFYRFQRLVDSGILQDASFGARFYTIWPSVLEVAREHTFGTLVSAPRAIELVDSGYLSYYTQGKWLFLAALAWLLACMWFWGVRGIFKTRKVGARLLLNLAIYFSMAMVVSNPLRAPLAIFFVVFGFWMLKCERIPRQWPCKVERKLLET